MPQRFPSAQRPLRFLLAGLSLAALAGCGPDPHHSGLTLTDAWAKAATGGNTAVFGVLTNPGDHDVVVTSGSSPRSKAVELHEVVMSAGAAEMRPKPGGFTVPAHGSHQLRPGGDHVMLIGLTGPVRAGDQVTATLTLAGGGSLQVTAIAKEFAGAGESYRPSATGSPATGSPATGSPATGSSATDMPGMDMPGMDVPGTGAAATSMP